MDSSELSIRKQNPEMMKVYDRLAKLEARIIKLESAIKFIQNCHMAPETRKQLDTILEAQ